MFRYYNTWQLDNDNVMQGAVTELSLSPHLSCRLLVLASHRAWRLVLLTRYLTAIHSHYICSGEDMIGVIVN